MAAPGLANSASTQGYADKIRIMRDEAMGMRIQNVSKNDPETALSEVIFTDAMVRIMARGLEIERFFCRSKLLLRKKKTARPKKGRAVV